MPDACLVLGRTGDQCLALPIMKAMADRNGLPMDVITSAPYASLFTGTSYAKPVVYSGPFSNVGAAKSAFSSKYHNIHVLQSYATDYPLPVPSGESFCDDVWNRSGFGSLFPALPLVFDKRNAAREQKLIESIGVHQEHKPIILLASSGNSSPFPYREQLKRTVQGVPHARVVDISDVRADRFYDLLGLYERAAALVCTDSAPLHLSRALPSLPVFAFITDKPSTWHGSRPHHANMTVRYSAAISNLPTLGRELERLVKPRLIHLVQDWVSSNPNAIRRDKLAAESWKPHYDSGAVTQSTFKPENYRTARTFGESKINSPVITDVIDDAVKKYPRDIIMFANSDIAVFESTPRLVRQSVAKFGCFYSHRLDVPSLELPLEEPKLHSIGTVYSGADLFAFTRDWWRRNRDRIPPLLMAFEGYDFLLKALMRESGFVPGTPCIVHEEHDTDSNWRADNTRPGQLHNRSLCSRWAEINGYGHYLLGGGGYLFAEL